MSFLKGMDISASGLSAQRLKMDVISDNIANLDTARYKRKSVVFKPAESGFEKYMGTLRKPLIRRRVRWLE
jgi:flagellar basal-body rod protein FlgC